MLLRVPGVEKSTEMIEARTDFMGLSAVKVGSFSGEGWIQVLHPKEGITPTGMSTVLSKWIITPI